MSQNTTTEKKPEIQSITILGRRWFDKINGNTYFSAVGLINGEEKARINFQYGYGDHYIDQIFTEFEKNGLIADFIHHNNGSTERAWQYCQRKEITFFYDATDVKRKKDL